MLRQRHNQLDLHESVGEESGAFETRYYVPRTPLKSTPTKDRRPFNNISNTPTRKHSHGSKKIITLTSPLKLNDVRADFKCLSREDTPHVGRGRGSSLRVSDAKCTREVDRKRGSDRNLSQRRPIDSSCRPTDEQPPSAAPKMCFDQHTMTKPDVCTSGTNTTPKNQCNVSTNTSPIAQCRSETSNALPVSSPKDVGGQGAAVHNRAPQPVPSPKPRCPSIERRHLRDQRREERRAQRKVSILSANPISDLRLDRGHMSSNQDARGITIEEDPKQGPTCTRASVCHAAPRRSSLRPNVDVIGLDAPPSRRMSRVSFSLPNEPKSATLPEHGTFQAPAPRVSSISHKQEINSIVASSIAVPQACHAEPRMSDATIAYSYEEHNSTAITFVAANHLLQGCGGAPSFGRTSRRASRADTLCDATIAFAEGSYLPSHSEVLEEKNNGAIESHISHCDQRASPSVGKGRAGLAQPKGRNSRKHQSALAPPQIDDASDGHLSLQDCVSHDHRSTSVVCVVDGRPSPSGDSKSRPLSSLPASDLRQPNAPVEKEPTQRRIHETHQSLAPTEPRVSQDRRSSSTIPIGPLKQRQSCQTITPPKVHRDVLMEIPLVCQQSKEPKRTQRNSQKRKAEDEGERCRETRWFRRLEREQLRKARRMDTNLRVEDQTKIKRKKDQP